MVRAQHEPGMGRDEAGIVFRLPRGSGVQDEVRGQLPVGQIVDHQGGPPPGAGAVVGGRQAVVIKDHGVEGLGPRGAEIGRASCRERVSSPV